ncbi:MAG: hypothetical protein AUJ71_02420 [Candidatus Omnitrophica bacterium CG1_02_49_16]|nr:MAG: hypothetical protein AUJ71_02420 [Candidatus Omnitrophica bacterium CG1_02_49_16]
MKTRVSFLIGSIILLVPISVAFVGVKSQPEIGTLAEAAESTNQSNNFNEDLKKATDYWRHNKLGSRYSEAGDYESAIEEYKKAIEIIENIPGENWGDVSQIEMNRINKESRVSKQIFSRYGLVEALEKTGRYEEALQNLDWLMQNQKVKGKEELLKQKLDGMKQNILQKIRQS